MKKRIVSGIFTVAALVTLSNFSSDQVCAPDALTKFDPKDPSSIPNMNCLLSDQNSVSWTDWLLGQSTSYQIHYLDLLELLHRNTHSNTPEN